MPAVDLHATGLEVLLSSFQSYLLWIDSVTSSVKAFNKHDKHTVWIVSLWVSLSGSCFTLKGIWYLDIFGSSHQRFLKLLGLSFQGKSSNPMHQCTNAPPRPLPMSTGEDLEKLVRLLENPWYAMMSLKLGGIEAGSPSLLLLEDMAWIVSMLGYGMLWHGMVWYRM